MRHAPHTSRGIPDGRWIVSVIVVALLLLWGMWYAFDFIRYILRGEFTFV